MTVVINIICCALMFTFITKIILRFLEYLREEHDKDKEEE